MTITLDEPCAGDDRISAHPTWITPRYRGFPGLANGGHLAGLFLVELGGTVEVTLRRPTPIAASLTMHRTTRTAELTDASGPLVTGRRVDTALEAPAPVSFGEAVEARRGYVGVEEARECFVCGTGRDAGDALRLFSGRVGHGRVAAPWVPGPSFAGMGGPVACEHVAAALDCPGAWAIAHAGEHLRAPMLLGRITLRHLRPVAVDQPHVVVGEFLGESGRKRFCSTAVYDAAGRACAVAHSIWFPFR